MSKQVIKNEVDPEPVVGSETKTPEVEAGSEKVEPEVEPLAPKGEEEVETKVKPLSPKGEENVENEEEESETDDFEEKLDELSYGTGKVKEAFVIVFGETVAGLFVPLENLLTHERNKLALSKEPVSEVEAAIQANQEAANKKLAELMAGRKE